jgi:hypothetical protein
VATTANIDIDKTARTAHEMAEAQRDSFEAIAENFAAAQRRGMGLAEGGLEFVRLQEDNARAAQEFFANGVRLLQLQHKNAEFVQGWMGEAVEVVREQTEHNARTAEAFARTASSQQESMRALSQGWVGAYREFFSPFAYLQQGMRTFQRATQQGLEVTEQVARQGLRASEQATRQGLRVAEEATERTEEVLRQTEKASHEAELRTAVFSALKTANYDELSVAEVSRRIEGLPTEQLKEAIDLGAELWGARLNKVFGRVADDVFAVSSVVIETGAGTNRSSSTPWWISRSRGCSGAGRTERR